MFIYLFIFADLDTSRSVALYLGTYDCPAGLVFVSPLQDCAPVSRLPNALRGLGETLVLSLWSDVKAREVGCYQGVSVSVYFLG
jgi:hypothetical protein